MRRAPMFVFALEGALFAFQLKNPALEPLSQLPPTCRPLADHPLKIKKHSKNQWGLATPRPRKLRFTEEASPEGRGRIGRRKVRIPSEEPGIGTTTPITAHTQTSIPCGLIEIITPPRCRSTSC